MQYELQPDQPRPWAQIHVGAAPGRDARWRYCTGDETINCVERHRITAAIDAPRLSRELATLQLWEDEQEAAQQDVFEQLFEQFVAYGFPEDLPVDQLAALAQDADEISKGR